MRKDQEILEIGKLVMELTLMGGPGSDLDDILERLFAVLANLPAIRVEAKGAINLCNTLGLYIQVAQFGVPSPWLNGVSTRTIRAAAPATPGAYIALRTIVEHEPAAPCFVLPLRDEGQPLGEALLFIAPDWHPDTVEFEFMSDLARALSSLVTRCVMGETLRVREIELEDARTDAIRRLGAAAEYRDNETGMHVMRMTNIAASIAKALGLSAEQREILSITAPMHDVGKIGIADAILLKPGKLDEGEFAVMMTHTSIGENILTGEDTLIAAARDIAAAHHENWDGSGYPRGLAGDAIPILARVCAIADVFDALTSTRSYKKAWSVQEATAWVHGEAGKKFDPAVVAAFTRALPEILRIRELYCDDIIDPNRVLHLPPLVRHEEAWVQWDAALSVGIDTIDEHHRYLFDLTNDLFAVVLKKLGSKEVARVLKALVQYAKIHFRAEERMMAHYGFAAVTEQVEQHRCFEDQVAVFYTALHQKPLTTPFDVLMYLKDWLVGHICHEDAELRALVASTAPAA